MYVFMENNMKLSFNYHQIPSLSEPRHEKTKVQISLRIRSWVVPGWKLRRQVFSWRGSSVSLNYLAVISVFNWAASWQNQQNGMCAQQRHRSAWASAQSDQSSLCAQWVAKDSSFLHVDNEDSDQTGWMPRLIWGFAGRTGHFVGFVMRQLNLLLLLLY